MDAENADTAEMYMIVLKDVLDGVPIQFSLIMVLLSAIIRNTFAANSGSGLYERD